jgi:hypothetical protein
MKKEQARPTYQINLPAQVRFDPKISANAKILYGEIKALCDKEGYCWASNGYLASLYRVKKETISDWLGQLKKQGMIRISIYHKQGNQRRIYLCDLTGRSCKKTEEDSLKTEDLTGNNGRAMRNISPPSSDFTTGNGDLFLIDNIIDNNDRIEKNNMFVQNGIGIEKKGNSLDRENFSDEGRASSPSPQVALPPVRRSPPSLKTKPSFTKPSVREVEDFLLEQQEISVTAMTARTQALRFVNYYEANGWKVGRNPMQDWQAAANNWLLNARQFQKPHDVSQLGRHNSRDKDYSIPL